MDERGEEEEHGVLGHEGLGQAVPSEAVVHVVEDALLAAPQVVELDDVPGGRHVVVGQDAAVGVVAFPQVEVPVGAPLPLDDKAVRLPLPFLHEDGVQLELDAVDFLPLPSPEGEDVVIERAASVGPDVEQLAMPLHLAHDVLGARSAVGPETVDADARRLEPAEEPPQGVVLVEAHVGVAVAVLDTDDHLADDGHGRPVSGEALVCHLRVVFPRLDELVVEVDIIRLARLQPARGEQGLDEQGVESVGGVEVVGLARIRRVGNALLGEFLDRPEDGVGTAGAECGMERKVLHQVGGHVFHARTPAEVDAHQRADDFAVPIAICLASQSKYGVDYG